MSLTKVTNSMILGADLNALDNGASSDGVTNNTAHVQTTLDQADGVDGSVVTSGKNVRISIEPGFSFANVIPFEDLTWPDDADVQFQGPTWETVLMKNQFSNPYQAIPVTTTAWAGSTAYSLGDKVVNGGNAYYCTTSGTSAASGGPSGTGTGIADGTVVWKYIVNGYYGPIPVNEWRLHAPYHPGIVLNNLTPASYDGVVQPAQQIAADLVAAGGSDTSRYKSIVFSQDNQGHWQQVSDGLNADLAFHHWNLLGQGRYYRAYFTGNYGDLCIQRSNINSDSYPLDTAGAMRLLTDHRTDVSPVAYDNQSRFPGRPVFYLQYRDDTANNISTIQLEGATGYQVGINAPNVVGVTAAVQFTAGDGSGNERAAGLDGFYNMWGPGADNITSLGRAAKRWSVVYAGTGTINTSDERLKQQIRPIDDAALRAWAKVEYVQYKWSDAVEAKGDGARWHFGLIAQRVKEAFESEGLDAFEYGVLCYDKWDATQEEKELDGRVIRQAMAAGDRYGIRYEEALALECAYLRSRLG